MHRAYSVRLRGLRPLHVGSGLINNLSAWETTLPLAWVGLIKARCFSGAAKGPSVLLVHPRSQSAAAVEEAMRLTASYAGHTCTALAVGSAQRLNISPATYLQAGAVESVGFQCNISAPEKVVVNSVLSGVQQRNLETAWGVPVLDRVGLIIEIFAQRAKSGEAKLQVEIAKLEYRASRLVRATNTETGKKGGFGEQGASEVVSARQRGSSGGASGGLGGGSGAGESELQLQRRRVDSRRKTLQRRLLEVRRTRNLQRAGRQRSGKPTIAVLGYTNAGKTSLVAALTKQLGGASGEDRLFATLDTTLRRLWLPSGRQAILSDTVGFISDLPTQLFDAFKGTLEEAVEADLILHVIDAASPDVLAQQATVYRVLKDLGVTDDQLRSRLVEVWNKSDLAPGLSAPEGLPPSELGTEPQVAVESSSSADVVSIQGDTDSGLPVTETTLTSEVPSSAVMPWDSTPDAPRYTALATSAVTGEGLEELLDAIDRKVAIKFGLVDLATKTARLGPRLLSQPVVGPRTVDKRSRNLHTSLVGTGLRQWVKAR